MRPFWLALVLALSACNNGTAIVTLTSTPSTDHFLAYRVGLASIQLQASGSGSSSKVLPAGTTVDFANLLDFSEVLAAAGVAKGTYTSAVMTLDYYNAQIVYDDGSLAGVALTPLNSSGQLAGVISVTTTLDGAQPFSIALKQSAALAIVFSMGASNLVNVANRTVTVTPLVGASAMPIDTKLVRIRGPVISVDAANLIYTSGVQPFDQSMVGLGQLSVIQSPTTTYEINGQPNVGLAGLSGLSSVAGGAMALSYGTLTAADTVTATTSAATSSSNVTFLATEVLAGSSLQSSGVDRVTGVVSARSGDTLIVEDATLIGADGTNTFLPGATLITVGPNTIVTAFGETTDQFFTAQQVSIGAVIDAFGTATNTSSGTASTGTASIGTVSLDASAGRIRVDLTKVSGLATAVGTAGLTLNLASFDGRPMSAFDFLGSGALPSQYSADGANVLELTNVKVGDPVVFTGFTSAFGAALPNFVATAPPITVNMPTSTLVDPTVIQAELLVDWRGGTAAPFITFDSSAMDLDVHNAAIGQRHVIQIGAQSVDISTLPQDPLISPDSTATAQLFSIGHAVSSSVENFNTYDAFITQLQTELNATTLATGMTATGTYSASSSAFAATNITLFLNN